MWSLIHTQPKRSAFDTRSARPTSRVQTEEASPYGVPLAHAIASRLVGEALHGDDRAEDLVLDHLVVLLQAGDDGRLEEEAGQVGLAAAGDDLGVAGAALEEALDALALARGVERAERRVGVERVAEHVALGLLGERRRRRRRRRLGPASTRVAAVQSWPAL